MRLTEAHAKLTQLKQPVIRTADAAACLGITATHASKLLERLAKDYLAISLGRGLWTLLLTIDPLIVPEYLTLPFPSYISLQTALYYHGMISQIPSTIYAVTLARTRTQQTFFGKISLHHVQPDFFFGFNLMGEGQHIKMAIPEKALIDILYLSPARSNLFKNLPELELPKNFNKKMIFKMIEKIPSTHRQTLIKNKLKILFAL